MKAMVTGATGFVGSHLVDQLLDRGDTVTALVRSPARAAPMAARGVRLITGDLAAKDAIAEAVAGQDVVFHAAAQWRDVPCLADHAVETEDEADHQPAHRSACYVPVTRVIAR